jgi:ice-binding like protein/Big-like domain-containing protein
MIMQRYSNYKICFTTLLLLLVANGCSDPDKTVAPGLTPPTVLSVAPSGASGACTNTIVSATFSEAMNPATINTSTFTLTGPNSASVSGVVTYDATSNTATFTPSGNLAASTSYTGTITTGVKDMFGNALVSNDVWTFITGVANCNGIGAPTVLSVTPADGACPNSAVTATFSEAMNASTINATTFTLTGAGAAGVVTYDAPDITATFTPSPALALNTTYTATITTGAQDLFGNALATDFTWTFTTAVATCQATVPLNSAANFEVLAGSTVTNTGPTIISGGDLGLSPGSAVTGFPPGTLTPPAVMHVTDPIAAQAQLDLTTAYNYAAGVQGAAVLPGDLSGLTFTPGVYKTSSTVMLSVGNVTLDAQGNANAVFIFQVGSTLTTLGSTHVILAGSAQAKNIFWQVGSSATLGTNSVFQGTILSLQSITLDTGASLTGRALARNGAVTLDSSTVTAP